MLFILFLTINGMAFSQVPSAFFVDRNAYDAYPILGTHLKSTPNLKKMPAIPNVQWLLAEDKELAGYGDFPFRFGYEFDVNYSLGDGTWEETENERIWRLSVSSQGAYSLNFIFSELNLKSDAKIYIFNPDGSMVYGPVTERQNIPQDGQFFLTDLIAGDHVVIQLHEPKTANDTSKLTISKVVHAYVNMFPTEVITKAAKYNCHNDVACYPEWATEAKSVALILLSSGSYWCTGALVNNTRQDKRPFFLSAFHCIDTDSDPYNLSEAEINNAQNWAFRFHYQKTTCNGSAVYNYVTYNYAYFRAAWGPTDFLLMELQNLNNAEENNIAFAGWDRRASVPSSGTGIHHPAGDLMKISFDYNNLVSNSTSISWTDNTTSPVNTHWKVGYDNGTTEGGSSGSPLFNQNHRIVGQLHGGGSGCPPVSKWYGRFDKSWTGGGTNETRLSNWLDPMSSNVTYLDGMDPGCTVETIQNKTFSNNTTINGCNIDVQNVTVKNGAKLTLDAEKEITINGPFEVETGAELEIK